jgi:anhydro-N-acetylmuramic acid kinase
MTVYPVIGLMSGTSLDGLDVCYAHFEESNGIWKYRIIATHCYEFDEYFREDLRQLPDGSAIELAAMHTSLGIVTGNYLLDFFKRFPESKESILIVSHGQTIFHRPDMHFTTQIGCGATIAALTGKPVVCDLRTMDVALGGQGAPLVPLGEKYLFPDFKQFLNIGGICNIALHDSVGISAFDVCPGNTLLNYFSRKMGLPYDDQGNIAASGKIDDALLHALNRLPFLKQTAPKSLGTEHIQQDWIPLAESFQLSIPDILNTCVEHIALQIAAVACDKDMLVTGGGAFHRYLIHRLQHHLPHIKVQVPDAETVAFKEALIMAFIGLQRFLGRPTALSDVTGASMNSVGGALYAAPAYKGE